MNRPPKRAVLLLADLLLSPRDFEVSVLVCLTRHQQAHQVIIHAKAVIHLIQIYVLPLHEKVQFLFGEHHCIWLDSMLPE